MKNGLPRLHLMLLLMGTVMPTSLWAQVKTAKQPVKTSPTNKPAAKPSETFAQSPFSLSISTVPTGYIGHDIKQIYKWLSTRPAGTEIAANQTIYGQVKVGSTLAFSEPVKDDAEYDAKRGIYDVRIYLYPNFNSQNGNELKNLRRIQARRDIVSSSSYTNAKKELILKSVTVEHGLLLDGWSGFALNRGKWGLDASAHMTFPLSANEAKTAKGNISVLYIYSLKAPYTWKIFQRDLASEDFPLETDNNYWQTRGDIQQIWLYNTKTGKIYQKLVPTPNVNVDNKFDYGPFSLESSVLYNYAGHDVKTIYRLLEQFPKGASLAENQPLYDDVKLGSTLAFSKKLQGKVLHVKDTGVIKVQLTPDIEFNQPEGLENTNRRRVVVDFKMDGQEKNTTSPGTRNVFKTITSEDNLSLDGWDSMPFEYESQLPFALLPFTKEQMQPAIGHLSVLYIYTLKPPYILKTITKSKPTELWPIEGELTYNSLRGDIKEVWIYNDQTGKVYRKIMAPS